MKREGLLPFALLTCRSLGPGLKRYGSQALNRERSVKDQWNVRGHTSLPCRLMYPAAFLPLTRVVLLNWRHPAGAVAAQLRVVPVSAARGFQRVVRASQVL